jgi:hypothetical protein
MDLAGRRHPAEKPALAWLPGSTEVQVVGETFRTEAIRATEHRTPRGQPMRAWLVPEPRNPHDRNAVAVHLEGALAGYLPAHVAAEVQPALLAFSAERNGQLVACPAYVHWWEVGPQVILFLDVRPLGLAPADFDHVPDVDLMILRMLPMLDAEAPAMTGYDQAGRALLAAAEARRIEVDEDPGRPPGAWPEVEELFLQAAARLGASCDPLAAAAWAGVARSRRYQKRRRDDRIEASITALHLDRTNSTAWADLIDLASSAPHVPTLLELFRRIPPETRPTLLNQLIAVSRGRDRLGNMHPRAGQRLRAGMAAIAQADGDRASLTKLRKEETKPKSSG